MTPIQRLLIFSLLCLSACHSNQNSRRLADVVADSIFAEAFPETIHSLINNHSSTIHNISKATTVSRSRELKLDPDSSSQITYSKVLGPRNRSKLKPEDRQRLGLERAILEYNSPNPIALDAFLNRLQQQVPFFASKRLRSRRQPDRQTIALALPDPQASLLIDHSPKHLRVIYKQRGPHNAASYASPRRRCQNIQSSTAFEKYRAIAIAGLENPFKELKAAPRTSSTQSHEQLESNPTRSSSEMGSADKYLAANPNEVYADSSSQAPSPKAQPAKPPAKNEPTAQTENLSNTPSPKQLALTERTFWRNHSRSSTSARKAQTAQLRAAFLPDFDARIEGLPIELELNWSIRSQGVYAKLQIQARWSLLDLASSSSVQLRQPSETSEEVELVLVNPPSNVRQQIRIYQLALKTRLQNTLKPSSKPRFLKLDLSQLKLDAPTKNGDWSPKLELSITLDKLFQDSSGKHLGVAEALKLLEEIEQAPSSFQLVPEQFLSLRVNLAPVKDWYRQQSLPQPQAQWLKLSQDYDSAEYTRWLQQNQSQ